VGVIIAVGEDEAKNAATLGYTQDYKASVGYPDTVTVVADPGWSVLREGISHANSIAMPFFAVLDSQMTLLYTGSDEGAVAGFIGTETQ
jgi:hypothetical protein